MRFNFDEDWFCSEKIRQPLLKATSQNFSERHKGPVFISVPELLERSTPDVDLASGSDPKTQVERVNEIITKRFLNCTDTVNTVCMITPTLTREVGYFPQMQYWENIDCECRDPDFTDSVERMCKSHYGYLLANS